MKNDIHWSAGVYDTNIILDYAAGIPQAKKAMKLCDVRVICALSYLEIMMTIPESRSEKMAEFLSANFDIEPLDKIAMNSALYYRNHYRMNIPDSLVYGYTRSRGLSLITRNIQSFNPHWGSIYVPYK